VPNLPENRGTRRASVVDVVVARWQVRRIGIDLEYPPDDRAGIGFQSGLLHRRKPFINRFAYDVRESYTALAKGLRLPEPFGIEPHIHQSRGHTVKIACLYGIAKPTPPSDPLVLHARAGATACKAPRHRWHSRQSRQSGIYNLQIPSRYSLNDLSSVAGDLADDSPANRLQHSAVSRGPR
jgi:hypothetical protein